MTGKYQHHIPHTDTTQLTPDMEQSILFSHTQHLLRARVLGRVLESLDMKIYFEYGEL